MPTSVTPESIKERALDIFSLGIDQFSRNIMSEIDEGTISIEDVEEHWGELLRQNEANISRLVSSYVSLSDKDELVREVKKKIRRSKSYKVGDQGFEEHYSQYSIWSTEHQ